MTESKQNYREEVVNAITHGIGAGLAVAGLVTLIIVAATRGTAVHVFSFSTFGSTMIILYLASTFYHAFRKEKLKTLFRKLDHMAIYLLIAGTYTPFCLTVLEGTLRWVVLTAIWSLAASGIVFKLFYTGKKELLSTILYLAMGWLAIVVIKPLYTLMSTDGFVLLMSGGACYTFGTWFYSRDRIRYNHGIWHVFVLAGTTLHFFSVLSLLQ